MQHINVDHYAKVATRKVKQYQNVLAAIQKDLNGLFDKVESVLSPVDFRKFMEVVGMEYDDESGNSFSQLKRSSFSRRRAVWFSQPTLWAGSSALDTAKTIVARIGVGNACVKAKI